MNCENQTMGWVIKWCMKKYQPYSDPFPYYRLETGLSSWVSTSREATRFNTLEEVRAALGRFTCSVAKDGYGAVAVRLVKKKSPPAVHEDGLDDNDIAFLIELAAGRQEDVTNFSDEEHVRLTDRLFAMDMVAKVKLPTDSGTYYWDAAIITDKGRQALLNRFKPKV